MKNLNLFIAGIITSGLTLLPLVASADVDELDVTMEVLDGVADLDGEVLEMRGPEPAGDEVFDEEADDDLLLEEMHEDDMRGEEEDDFTNDEEFVSEEDEEHTEDESEFDEGDEIDTDEFDEVEMEEEDDMPEEETAGVQEEDGTENSDVV